MVEKLVKTFKHGLIILFDNPKHTQDWDKHLPRILFGYRCGVQLNTKFFSYMLLTRRTPHLKAYNSLSPLVQANDDDENPTIITSKMISKLFLISKIFKKF